MKCQSILPHFVKDVEYSRVRDIDFKSAQTLKCELDKNIENGTLSGAEDIVNTKPNAKENIASPSKVEMKVCYEELSKCKTKTVVLSVVEHYSENYILPSRNIQTIPSLFACVSYNCPMGLAVLPEVK